MSKVKSDLQISQNEVVSASNILLDRDRYFINEAGVTFDNSFFDNYFDFLRQLKNGLFLGPVLYMSLVEVRINQT